MAKLVSKTYGDALFQLAIENQSIDASLEEVKLFRKILLENQDFVKLMNHPQIDKEEKIRLLTTIFEEKISREFLGLLEQIVKKGRFEYLDEVLGYFIDEVKEYKNIGTALVISASPLSDMQKEQVRKRLLETTKYVEFDLEFQEDAKLIGGMVIRIGDRVVDSSVRTRINELAKELSKIQLKAGECAP